MNMIEKNATAVTYVSSGAAMIFGVSATEFAAIVGAGVAVLTFAVNWYYKHRAFKLMQERCDVKVDD